MASNFSNTYTFLFMMILCALCALILSIVVTLLAPQQHHAKSIAQQKQLLISARMLSHEGYFLIGNQKAKQDPISSLLSPDPQARCAQEHEISTLASKHLLPLLTNDQGELFPSQEPHPCGLHPLYGIRPNTEEGLSTPLEAILEEPHRLEGVILPVQGMGLWGPLSGYLAIHHDGCTILGTTWYDHQETPGLGANIANSSWQQQFYQKKIFASEDLACSTPKICITKGKSLTGNPYTIDGISGATITCNGVMAAYQNTIPQYRALFIRLRAP